MTYELTSSPIATNTLYHEKQRAGLCLKHTLNNLLQGPRFTRQDLDAIAGSLSPTKLLFFNPHKTWLLGNYDLNVMIAALQTFDKEVRWHDERDAGFAHLEAERAWAIVINRACGGTGWGRVLRPLSSGRHFAGLRRIGECWWFFDSDAPFPVQITTPGAGCEREEVCDFLRGLRAEDDSLHIFVVTDARPERP